MDLECLSKGLRLRLLGGSGNFKRYDLMGGLPVSEGVTFLLFYSCPGQEVSSFGIYCHQDILPYQRTKSKGAHPPWTGKLQNYEPKYTSSLHKFIISSSFVSVMER
jgi:hypothetical protein